MIFKRFMLIVLLLTTTVLANSVAYAAGLCVHPSGAGRCFSSIQAAVDAANDGDQITIRAGRYIEQVSIMGKDLTLVGQSGATVQAPANMEDKQSPITGFPGRPILFITDAEVTIRDLTIDGANSAENNPFLEGIAFINAGGVIHDNIVKNIGFGTPTLPITEVGPSYQGDAIVVFNIVATPRTVTIADNRIINYNNNGIIVDAEADPTNPAIANLTAHVVDNTVIGSGPNNVIDQWGIFFGGFGFADSQFSITGTVSGNEIRDQLSLAPHPLPGVGIVMFNSYNVEISDNEIENVNVGMAANQGFSTQIIDNLIVGPGQEAFGSTGLLLSGRDTRVAENHFRKLETGILLFIEDPNFGSALSTAIDENRFEQVAVDLMTGPGASEVATAQTVTLWTKLTAR